MGPTVAQSLTEARVHLDAADRWAHYAVERPELAQLAARMCALHRLRAVGWLIGAPPFT